MVCVCVCGRSVFDKAWHEVRLGQSVALELARRGGGEEGEASPSQMCASPYCFWGRICLQKLLREFTERERERKRKICMYEI